MDFAFNTFLFFGKLYSTAVLVYSFRRKRCFASYIIRLLFLIMIPGLVLQSCEDMGAAFIIAVYVLVMCESVLSLATIWIHPGNRKTKERFACILAAVSLVSGIAINGWFASCLIEKNPVISQKVDEICERINTDWSVVSGLISSKEQSEDEYTVVYDEENTIANNMDTVLLLQEHEWEKLSVSEKKDVLNVILSIECRCLGINRKIKLEFRELGKETVGSYGYSSSTIYISSQLLEEGSAHENLDALCHEVFHAAEYQFVDIYLSLSEADRKSIFINHDLAETYLYELNNYIDGENDYSAYRNQRCEIDSRVYGAASVKDYYARIEKYLAEND